MNYIYIYNYYIYFSGTITEAANCMNAYFIVRIQLIVSDTLYTSPCILYFANSILRSQKFFL